jgi:hypothetical protein
MSSDPASQFSQAPLLRVIGGGVVSVWYRKEEPHGALGQSGRSDLCRYSVSSGLHTGPRPVPGSLLDLGRGVALLSRQGGRPHLGIWANLPGDGSEHLHFRGPSSRRYPSFLGFLGFGFVPMLCPCAQEPA